jgi:hypothetical protein
VPVLIALVSVLAFIGTVVWMVLVMRRLTDIRNALQRPTVEPEPQPEPDPDARNLARIERGFK